MSLFIFWYDYVLLPFYLFGMSIYLNRYFKRKHGYDPVLKKHFKRGIIFKVIGCIFIGMIYEYYYKGAYDGYSYFLCGKMLTGYWGNHPSEFFHVLTSDMNNFNATNYDGLTTQQVNIFANQSFFICKIVALFNLLSFNAFLPCSLFFCLFAFMGLWNLFNFFRNEFKLSAQIAGLCTIYIPSVLIWDSSIFKDTVTFTALCWLFISGYYCFIKPRKFLLHLCIFALSIFLIVSIKVYIIAAFAPFFILYVFNSYKSRIKNQTLKIISTPFVLAISGGLIFLLLQNANDLLGRYSVDQVLETAMQTYNDINSVGQAGSAYTINVDFSSPLGLLAAIPTGINITLFRPYPWEYLKPIILFASLESMTILVLTIWIIFKIGLARLIKTIWTSPTIQFCLFFSLIFSFMVGISSSNFGSLVRYKIPALPFYLLFLALLYQKHYHTVFKRQPTKRQLARASMARA